MRAIAASAYRHGAKFVDVGVVRPARQARADRARAPTTRSSSSRRGTASASSRSATQRAARVALSGPAAPGLLDDLDPVRAGRDRLPSIARGRQGRQRPHDELDDRARARRRRGPSSSSRTSSAAERWRGSSASSCTSCGSTRTTRSPPGARAPTRSSRVAERLTERRFDALHYEGPGTDLTVGLLPIVAAGAPRASRPSTGIEHMPNLPTEEVFTSPDPSARRRHVSRRRSRSC